MNYFCKCHLQSRADQEVDTYINLDSSMFGENETPNLTKEILLSSKQYNDFISAYGKKPKIVNVEYTVFSTDEKITEDTQEEFLESLIQSGQAMKVAGSEINIDCARDRISLKKRKKISPYKIAAFSGGALALVALAFIGGRSIGYKMGAANAVPADTIDEETTMAEDGMIIPLQGDINDDANQITVLIDRSYLAVPTEDFQLKGEVVDGAADITLPEFDKTDYLNHVPGYTWGFSTDPDADKIEYYGGQTYSFKKDTKLYRVLVKYGGGNGTKTDPYIIDYFDQLELMSEEKAGGYFKQTADIEFPDWAEHTPIDTISELSTDEHEYFVYDGNGFKISGLNAPLFGKVYGALIENVNIVNSTIVSTEYQDYGFIVRQAYNYEFTVDGTSTDEETTAAEDGSVSYMTGETMIKHCSVSHSAIKLEYPEAEKNDQETAEPIIVTPDDESKSADNITPEAETKIAEHSIGAISGVGGQIEDCYVNDVGIYNNLDEYFLYAGGISGAPANVSNSCVYLFSASGHIFNAGGIAGCGNGTRMISQLGQGEPDYYGGNIQGCVARNILLEAEKAAGGVIGSGGCSVKDGAVISNCYATELDLNAGVYDKDGKIVNPGITGGVIGSDDGIYAHYVMNTVSPANLKVIGKKYRSSYDNTVRTAPDHAYYQTSILNIINASSANPNSPKEMFTGNFKFGEANVFGSENGSLAYPESIADLFEITVDNSNENTEENSNE